MVSEAKLIKVGIKYSDQFFEQLKKIYGDAYRDADSLEEFLDETKDYSISNPLETRGYKNQMVDLIVSSTNNIKYSRPAQKALMQTIIRNTTGELIVDVGDDIKSGVRDIVNRGYREGKLNHVRVAKEINHELDGINHKRARTIARTEIKRAQTTSNYVIAKERGANAYKYKCGAKPCDICKGDCRKTFPIDDVEHLPPRHPNCMCGVTFFVDPNLPKPNEEPVEPTSTITDGIKQSQLKGSMFEGKYTTTTEKDPLTNSKINIRKYSNGLELAVSEDSGFIIDEIKAHIESLPQRFQQLELTRINILKSEKERSGGGYYNPYTKTVNFHTYGRSMSKDLDGITHEFSHAIDAQMGTNTTTNLFGASSIDKYKSIHEADNDPTIYIDTLTGESKTFDDFPTSYARNNYFEHKKEYAELEEQSKKEGSNLLVQDNSFMEDFAESSKLFLNPATHDEFVKNFPNRAEYLEEIYGKPVFDKNSPLYKALVEEGLIYSFFHVYQFT